MKHIHYFKKSYEIEQKFYEHYSDEISHQESCCKIPKCFGSSQDRAQVGYQNIFDCRFIQNSQGVLKHSTAFWCDKIFIFHDNSSNSNKLISVKKIFVPHFQAIMMKMLVTNFDRNGSLRNGAI